MLKQTDFKCSTLFELASIFFNKWDTHYTRASYTARKLKTITTYFGNISISQIEPKYICESLENDDTFSDFACLRVFTDFLFFLTNNEITFERSEIFNAYYQTEYFESVKKKNIVLLFSSARFLDYYKREMYLNKELVSLSFLLFEDDILFDLETKEIVGDYIDSVKFDDDLSILTRLNNIPLCITQFTELFKKYELKILTPTLVAGHIRCANNPSLSGKFIMRLCFYLQESKYFKDNRFEFLNNLTPYCKQGFPSLETLFQVLDTPSPWKFMLYSKSRSKDPGLLYLAYFNCDSDEIRSVLYEYTCIQGHTLPVINDFIASFQSSLENLNVDCIFDFNYSTFISQINWAKLTNSIFVVGYVIGFYNYIAQKYYPNIFSSEYINSSVLQRHSLAGELIEGYQIISYNMADNPPKPDKVLLHLFSEATLNTSISTSNTIALNFEQIKSVEYRDWVKYFIWNSNTGFASKTNNLLQSSLFCNYTYDLKVGNVLSIHGKKSSDFSVSSMDAFAYKSYIANTSNKQSSKSKYILCARNLLKFVLDHNLGSVEPAALHQLSIHSQTNIGSPEAIDDTELNKLTEVVRKRSFNSQYELSLAIIYYLMIETEMRLSQIRVLKTGCIHEANKPNEWVIFSLTKTSNGKEIEQPTTIYCKEKIELAESCTQNLRNQCNIPDIKKHVFIKAGDKIDSIVLITSLDFSQFLKSCCNEAGIKGYSPSNLRDTHMTQTQKYAIREALSNMKLAAIDGHKSVITSQNTYVDLDIKEMLEAIHGVIIGDKTIDGKVLQEVPEWLNQDDRLVSNGCGYCSSDSCNDYSYLDCLLCKYFWATIDKIPFFEEQLKVTDGKIESATVRHDKEDLYNIKRLLTNYLIALMSMNKAGENT